MKMFVFIAAALLALLAAGLVWFTAGVRTSDRAAPVTVAEPAPSPAAPQQPAASEPVKKSVSTRTEMKAGSVRREGPPAADVSKPVREVRPRDLEAGRPKPSPPRTSAGPRVGSAGPITTTAEKPATAARTYPVDDVLAQLEVGAMAFRHPQSMLRGETEVVTLLVSQSEAAAALVQRLQSAVYIVEGNSLRIAPVMQAHLTGGAFEIRPITEEKQPISAREATEWKWEITAREFGELPLHLAVNAIVALDGREHTRTLQTFEETVRVRVSWSASVLDFMGEHVEWVLTGVLVPLLGWLISRWKHRRRSTATHHHKRPRPPVPAGR